MFRNTFQKGFLSIFYSIGSKPLLIWDTKVEHGNIKRITDEETKSLALDIRGVNVETCYITAPNVPCKSLGIKMPFLTIIVKNMRKSFSFEIQILDDRNQLRRFRYSSYQRHSRVSTFTTYMPLALNRGWNQIQVNLADFTRRAYGTNYMEVVRVTIHANCRLRNIYFSDRLYNDDEKPSAFKLLRKDETRLVAQTSLRTLPKATNTIQEVQNIQEETVRPTSPISHAQTDIKLPINEMANELLNTDEQ